jgi:monofunctional biosynthetic peptidoglycan transglycosylase
MANVQDLMEPASRETPARSRRFPRTLFKLAALAFLLFILTLTAAAIFLGSTTPDVAWLQTTDPQETSLMRDRARQQGRGNQPPRKIWHWVPLSRISPYLIRSVIVAEDKEFFRNSGFDLESVFQALLLDIREERIVAGGSSITQQLAKNLFLGTSRSPMRKIREALITYKLEKDLTKDRILELYLNVIQWGPGIYGADAAARTYFHKSAADLTLPDAIRLASILPDPDHFSPLSTAAVPAQRRIALRLLEQGWIGRSRYDQILRELYRFDTSQTTEPVAVPPPTVSFHLLDSNYWVAKLSEPDKIIMTAEQIAHFNERALIMSGGMNLRALPDSLSRTDVIEKISEVAGLPPPFLVDYARGCKDSPPAELNSELALDGVQLRYDRNNTPLTGRFYCNLLDALNVKAIPHEVRIRYALVVKRTDVLAWPVDTLIMDKPYDYEFNALVQSSAYLGTPVAVFSTSRDGRWAFVRTAYFDGWIKQEDLAWSSREEAINYPGPHFVVVTALRVRTVSGLDLPMGTRASIAGASASGYTVKIPTRGSAGELVLADDSVSFDGVSEGFLPYTRRNIITQAFKLLQGPYRWGGGGSGWDCSSFVQDVFSVFGIKLPRNSSWQPIVGKAIAAFGKETPLEDKVNTIPRWEPATTLIGLPGHIMLYLGEDRGKPYAIHALWGVKDKDGNLIKVNRIAVTGLGLGRGGRQGSLLDRATAVGGVYVDSLEFQGLLRDFLDWLGSHPLRVAAGLSLMGLLSLGFMLIVFVIYPSEQGRKRDRRAGSRALLQHPLASAKPCRPEATRE